MANTIQFGSLYLGKTPEIAQCVYPCHRPAISVGDMVGGKEVRWVLVDGLLVASYSFLHEVSWEDLEAQGLVEGREVVIDGSRYRCRLLCTFGNSRTQLDEWELSKKTVYPELQVLSMDREDGGFWVLGPFGPELKLGCKKDGRAEYSWRPVLEPISLDFSRLKKGNYVQLGCGANLISGFLEETTDYDLILDKNFSQVSEAYLGDIEDFAHKEKNGRLAVDKSAISVARANNARRRDHLAVCNMSSLFCKTGSSSLVVRNDLLTAGRGRGEGAISRTRHRFPRGNRPGRETLLQKNPRLFSSLKKILCRNCPFQEGAVRPACRE